MRRSVRLTLFLFALTPLAHAQAPMTSPEERVTLHQSAEWLNLVEHLPDPNIATAAQLETAGDVLRIRRFPEDALDYYGYALARGGKVPVLLNKMGIVHLELHQVDLAREMFRRVVRSDKRNASAWNNLGAAEFVAKHYKEAVSDYRRAASLDKHSAIFQSNLGMVYFEDGKMEDARDAFARAILLDSTVLRHRDEGGLTAHVVSSGNSAALYFQIARLFAARHDNENVYLWLSRSVESGYDPTADIATDPLLYRYSKDPAVLLILSNAKQMRKRNVASIKNIPALGTDLEVTHFD